jgi:chromosomal replication initiator protein
MRENRAGDLAKRAANRYNTSLPRMSGACQALPLSKDAPRVLDGVVEIPLSGRPVRSSLLRQGHSAPLLEQFVVGPENRLVEVAVLSLLNDEDDYSPIVFFGPSGTGKSHLALGLTTAWKARFPKRRAAYLPAGDFVRELVEAVQTKTVEDFGARYRRLSLLVLDDLEHMARKPGAQRELTFTLDALEVAGSHVVITANRFPGDVTGLMAGLRSRLAQGLSVALARPGREARLAILRRFAQSRDIRFAEGAAEMLAAGLRKTVPELLGAISQLAFSAGSRPGLIEPKHVREYLAQCNGSQHPCLSEIASLTARCFSLPLRDLRSPSRRRPAPTARALAMYLARNLTDHTLEQIGRYFGGRDHTTVLYSCRKTEERLHSEPEIRDAALAIQQQLEGT